MIWRHLICILNKISHQNLNCIRKIQAEYSSDKSIVFNRIKKSTCRSLRYVSGLRTVETSCETCEENPRQSVLYVQVISMDDVLNEYNTAKNAGERVPKNLNPEHIDELILLKTKSQRFKYLSYLFKKEKSTENAKLKKEKQKEDRELSHLEQESKKAKHTLLLYLRKSSMLRFTKVRLAYANLFGPKLVIDLDYDQYMTRKEIRNAISQIQFLIASNSMNRSPFDLYICNAKNTNYSRQYLDKLIPRLKDSDCYGTCMEESYLEHFPKEKLVYLSPHASEELAEFDANAVYIIGAYVDLVKSMKISQNKAKEEGIRSYSLPLNTYIEWGIGSKCLSINQVFDIMLGLKNTGDWKKALGAVPTRKVKKVDIDSTKEAEDSDKIFLIDTRKKK